MPDINLNAVSTLATLIIAIASLITGIAALFNIYATKKQMKYTEKQLVLLRNERLPYLEVEKISVRKNKIELTLSNKTNYSATLIGIRTELIPVIFKNYDNWIFKHEIKDYRENRKAYFSSAIVLLKNEKGKCRLEPKTNDTFEAEVKFFVSYVKPGESVLSAINENYGRFIDFDEAIKLLRLNGFRYGYLSISLIYKDINEEYTETTPLYDLLLDSENHKCLEDVVSQNLTFKPRAVNMEELEVMPYELYKELKTWKSFLEKKLF